MGSRNGGLGFLLIALGVFFLLARVAGFTWAIGWPFFVFIPGLLLLAVVALGGKELPG